MPISTHPSQLSKDNQSNLNSIPHQQNQSLKDKTE